PRARLRPRPAGSVTRFFLFSPEYRGEGATFFPPSPLYSGERGEGSALDPPPACRLHSNFPSSPLIPVVRVSHHPIASPPLPPPPPADYTEPSPPPASSPSLG